MSEFNRHRARKILGIDAGLAELGWGVVAALEPGRYQYLASGSVKTEPCKRLSKTEDMYRRLHILRDAVLEVAVAHDVEHAAFEAFEMYGDKGRNSIVQVSNVTGMLDTLLAAYGVMVYTTQRVKAAVAGHRHSKKLAVKNAVLRILQWNPGKRTVNHEIDALAVAICHGQLGGITCGK